MFKVGRNYRFRNLPGFYAGILAQDCSSRMEPLHVVIRRESDNLIIGYASKTLAGKEFGQVGDSDTDMITNEEYEK